MEEGNIKSLRLKGRKRVPANCASITRFIIHMWPFIAYGIDIDGACVALLTVLGKHDRLKLSFVSIFLE